MDILYFRARVLATAPSAPSLVAGVVQGRRVLDAPGRQHPTGRRRS